MKRNRLALCLLAAAIIGIPLSSSAQNEISRRTEQQTGTIAPIQAGATSVRDPAASQGSPGIIMRTGPMAGAPGAGAIIGSMRTFTSEVEVVTYGYQIPDFNSDDLYTHHYHFGMFSESGNGSGTAYPDVEGYVEFEINNRSQESEWQTFLYSIHADTGEPRMFMDIADLTVNQAVSILTNVALNSRMNARGYRLQANGFPPRGRIRFPPEIGNQRRLTLRGDYLTLDDIQEQIFSQARCNVEQEDGAYYLESCS